MTAHTNKAFSECCHGQAYTLVGKTWCVSNTPNQEMKKKKKVLRPTSAASCQLATLTPVCLCEIVLYVHDLRVYHQHSNAGYICVLSYE